jgi:hypothetical protein
VTEAKLLELDMVWTGLPHGQARIAERLRLFMVTWDPLGPGEQSPTPG